MTPCGGHVDAADLAPLERGGQLPVRRVVLGDDDEAGRVTVETVHDTRPQDTADAGQVGDVMQQRIHEGTRIVAGRGVNDEAGRLVYDQQIGILVHDDEWNVLGCEPCRHGHRHVDIDDVAVIQPLTLPRGGAVDENARLLEQLSGAGAGKIGVVCCEIRVQAGIAGVRDYEPFARRLRVAQSAAPPSRGRAPG